ADRVVNAGHEGDLELRSDAVGRGDEHRMAVLQAFEVEEPAETADAGEQPWARGLERDAADAADQAVACGDIDAGAAVGDAFARYENFTPILSRPNSRRTARAWRESSARSGRILRRPSSRSYAAVREQSAGARSHVPAGPTGQRRYRKAIPPLECC